MGDKNEETVILGSIFCLICFIFGQIILYCQSRYKRMKERRRIMVEA